MKDIEIHQLEKEVGNVHRCVSFIINSIVIIITLSLSLLLLSIYFKLLKNKNICKGQLKSIKWNIIYNN